MATNPLIALQGRVTDVAGNLASGQATGERFRTAGVREQILDQQAQQGQRTQGLQKAQTTSSLLTGLKSLPLDQRASVMAQQMPMLVEMGLTQEDILTQDLSNTGLDQTITGLQPFLKSEQGQSKFGFGATQTVNRDGELFSITQVRDPSTGEVRVVEVPIEGELVSNIGETPSQRQAREVETAEQKELATGRSELIVDLEAQVALLQGEIDKAQAIAEVKSDVKVEEVQEIEDIKVDIKAADPATIAAAERARLTAKAAAEEVNLGIDASFKTIENIDAILSSDRLDDIAGFKGKFPSGRPKTLDLLNTVQQLSSLLTVGNLDVMSGVLSESDMKVIKGLANDIGIKFGEGDEANTSKGFSGSVEATVNKLRTLKKEISGRLRRQGYGLEGDIISNPTTGQRMQFINKEWVAL